MDASSLVTKDIADGDLPPLQDLKIYIVIRFYFFVFDVFHTLYTGIDATVQAVLRS